MVVTNLLRTVWHEVGGPGSAAPVVVGAAFLVHSIGRFVLTWRKLSILERAAHTPTDAASRHLRALSDLWPADGGSRRAKDQAYARTRRDGRVKRRRQSVDDRT